MDLTAIIVNFNTGHLLPSCVSALRAAATAFDLKIVLVDNASRDNSLDIIRQQLSDCHLIANAINVGFGRANNQALEHVEGEFVLLLNTDAMVAPDSLDKTLAYMRGDDACGVLGVNLVGGDGLPQPSCRFFPTPSNVLVETFNLKRLLPGVRLVDDATLDSTATRHCDWVPGCFYLVRRKVIDQVGLFDPRYFLYFEEVDHCKASKAAGWNVVFFPHTTVVHTGGESAKSVGPVTTAGQQISVLQVESEILYFRKHHGKLGTLVLSLARTLGPLVAAAKTLVKRGRVAGLGQRLGQVRDFWRILYRTAAGTSAVH